jgi:hypothetical protein
MADQYGQLKKAMGQMGGGVNPYMAAGGDVLGYLADYLGGGEQRKQERWRFGQQKDLYDDIRWNRLGRDAVSDQKVGNIRSNIRESMQPAFADMNWMAQRKGGGLSSPQSSRMYAQARLPVEAGISADLQKWQTETNIRSEEGLLQLLAMLSGGR